MEHETSPPYKVDHALETMSNLNFIGHIVPHAWFQAENLKKAGKTHHLAIMILADIVYWYRSAPILDESTGKLLGYKKKFKVDMLQRNYQNFATLFGCSRRQATETIKFLADAGIIHKELRSIKTQMGTIHNVLFVAPNASAIAKLQANFTIIPDEKENEEDPYFVAAPKKDSYGTLIDTRTLSDANTDRALRKRVEVHHEKSDTYTKNTTKTKTKKTLTKPSSEIETQKTTMPATNETGSVEVILNNEKGRGNNSTSAQPYPASSLAEKFGTIASSLTEPQETELKQRFEQLCKGSLQHKLSNPAQVYDEIHFCLLDKTALSNCENNFHRKLCCISSMLEKQRWRTPAGMNPVTTAQQSHAKIDESNPQQQELKDLRHKMVNLCQDIIGDESFLSKLGDMADIRTIEIIEAKNNDRNQELQLLKSQEKKLMACMAMTILPYFEQASRNHLNTPGGISI